MRFGSKVQFQKKKKLKQVNQKINTWIIIDYSLVTVLKMKGVYIKMETKRAHFKKKAYKKPET